MKPETLSDIFRANMRAIREELGLSQSALARKVGRMPSYVCDLENKRRPKVTLETVAVVAGGLGVAPAELLTSATALRHRKSNIVKDADRQKHARRR